MARRRATPGTHQINVELAEALHAELKAFTAARGESARQVVEHALRRHFAHPPPLQPPAEPFPPEPPAPPKPRRKKG